MEKTLWEEDSSMRGYSWYDKLPRVADAEVFIDSIEYQDWRKTETRPVKIEVNVTIAQSGESDRDICLPASIHVDSEEYNDASFVAVRQSPWDNDALDGPFDVVEFLMWATFLASDDSESDSWDTQRDSYANWLRRQANEYFRGPRATLLAVLRDAIDWESRQLAQQIGVVEIRFKKSASDSTWDIELVSPPAATTTESAQAQP
jgi:hypothetical protein